MVYVEIHTRDQEDMRLGTLEATLMVSIASEPPSLLPIITPVWLKHLLNHRTTLITP